MKRNVLIMLLLSVLLVACGSNVEPIDDEEVPIAAEGENSLSPTATERPIPTDTSEPQPTDTAVPQPTATAEPDPTSSPEPAVEPARITSEEDLVGVWLGTVAGETGYVMYTADGQYRVSLVEDNLTAAPRISGEYWFEDGHLHLRDLQNAGHWVDCSADTVGVYDAVLLDSGKVRFETVEDACNEGGFTRNYIFANMTQEWIDEAAVTSALENGESASSNPELAAALQSIVDNWVAEGGAPAVVMMIDAPDLDFTWKGVAGQADPEAGVAMVADDQFIVSSITKMYTAATILKLVEQDRLALDDPISQYLNADLVAQIHVQEGFSRGEEITVRQLLNHTSGLGDFSNGADNDGNGRPDFKDLVLSEPETMWDEDMVLDWAIANVPPAADPGLEYHYSDTNYQLLGKIIEQATELSLPDAYRQLIFAPLQMEHTYFEFVEDVVPGVENRPVSHAYYGGTLWNDLDSHSYEWGSGGLVSTAADQNRFLWALVNDELFENPATKEAMLDWIETSDPGGYYGLGVLRIVFEEFDVPGLGEVYGHGGLFNSGAFYWPQQNMTIITTLNSNEPQFGFVFLMIEAMYTLQEFSG